MFNEIQKAENVKTFLERKDATFSLIEKQIKDVYGDTLFAFVSGSVVEGYGNETSDIDIICVVDRSGLSQLPVMTYVDLVKFDTEYYSVDAMEKHLDVINLDWPFQIPLNQEHWKKQYSSLKICSKFISGLAIKGTDNWKYLHKNYDKEKFLNKLTSWWMIEAVRNLIVSKILFDLNIRSSELKLFDAGFCVLASRVTSCGENVITKKWIPEKLKHISDEHGLQLAEELLINSFLIHSNSDLFYKYYTYVKDYVLLELNELDICCYLSSGVSIDVISTDKYILSKWHNNFEIISSSECSKINLSLARTDAPVFKQSLMNDIPYLIKYLIAHQYLWVGVYNTKSESS
jgi:hypothetical protein